VLPNAAFCILIGGKISRQTSNKPPSQYFPGLIARIGHGPYEAQCIPTEPALLEVENHPTFLAERRKAISAHLNSFLGTA
jgi:hypothetical protein